jgi:hypothetical protein
LLLAQIDDTFRLVFVSPVLPGSNPSTVVTESSGPNRQFSQPVRLAASLQAHCFAGLMPALM